MLELKWLFPRNGDVDIGLTTEISLFSKRGVLFLILITGESVMSQETGSYPLNSQQAHEFSNFHALLTSWAGAYPFSMISYVSVKTAKGPRLLFGRILLLPSCTLAKDTPFRFETEHILAARFVSDMTAADVAQSLEKAKTRLIPTVDDAMTIELERNGYFSAHFDPISSPFFSVPEGKRSPCLVLHGMPRYTLLSNCLGSRPLDRLNWELKAADMPFDNLDELLTYCGLPKMMQMGDSTVFEVVASPPGWIGDGSTIRNGEASIECHVASALDIGKVKLGYETFPKDSGKRASIDGSVLEWRHEGDIKIGTHRIQVGKAPELQAFLSYESFCLHQLRVWDPQKHLNSRHAIHQVFDKNLDFLRRTLLEPKPNKADAFEGAVSACFHLFGFSAVNYGRILRLQDGPDIIAMTPTGNVLVIECTLGLLDKNDKLAKLVQRTTVIKEKLASAGYDHLQIQSAIVTPLSRDEVAANLKIAEEHGIAVICKEEIIKLLDQVSLPPDPERIFEDLKGLVPGVHKGSFF